MFFGTYHFWILGVKLSCANLFATPGDLRWLPGVYQMEVKAPGKKPVSLCKDVLTRKWSWIARRMKNRQEAVFVQLILMVDFAKSNDGKIRWDHRYANAGIYL